MAHEQSEETRNKLKSLLVRLSARGTRRHFVLLFEKYHMADIAEALSDLTFEDRVRFFKLHTRISFDDMVEVFEQIPSQDQIELITEFSKAFSLKILKHMDSDDAASLLSELMDKDQDYAQFLIDALPKQDATLLKGMMSQVDTAGSMMNTDFLSIPENLSVKEALTYFRSQDPPDTETSFFIFVVDESDHLVGCTTLRTLIMAAESEEVKELIDEYPSKALVSMDKEAVARLFEKYDLVVVPVVDEDDHLKGIITIDDIVDVVIEEATEDIYKLSGTTHVEEEKLLEGSILHPIASRLPWLVVTIFGGLLASYLITGFSHIYSPKLYSVAAALSFVPMLMGLGGTVGNQSSTIIVRGISTGVVREDRFSHYVFREVLVGLSIGAIVAVIFSLLSLLFGYNPVIACIVAVSLLVNISFATLLGSLLPVVFKRFKIDPAVASAPFISSTLDITAQLIYFSITLGVMAFFIG